MDERVPVRCAGNEPRFAASNRKDKDNMLAKIIGFALLAWAIAAPVSAAETLYGADGSQGSPSNLLILDARNGALICTIGPIGFGVTGLAVHPTTGVLFGSTGNRSPVSPGSLITVNKETGAGTLVGSFGLAGKTMADLTFTSDGTLYGWLSDPAGGPEDLYTINLATGTATKVGTSGLSDTFGGALASSSSGIIFLAAERDDGPLRTVNRTTGAVTTVATLDGTSGNAIPAMKFNAAGVLFAVDLSSGNPPLAELMTINTSSGALTALGPSVDRLSAIAFDNTQTANLPLVASILPSSRSVQVGTPATAFATIINAGTSPAIGVCISPITSIPAEFTFQTTNPNTNQVTGTPKTAVTIGPGQAQTYVIVSDPTDTFPPTDVAFSFVGSNTLPAGELVGVNTLLLTASSVLVPDIVALAATVTNDGIVNIPGPNGNAAFAVATVNVGASSSITATADTGGVNLPVFLFICQTNPVNAQCVNPMTPATSVTVTINTNDTPTFGIFIAGQGLVPFNPATNRVFVRFKDQNGVVRGSTSVAVRTQ